MDTARPCTFVQGPKSPPQLNTAMMSCPMQCPKLSEVWERNRFSRQVQLWEHDCLLHNGTCGTTHHQRYREIDHLVHEQRGNLHDQLKAWIMGASASIQECGRPEKPARTRDIDHHVEEQLGISMVRRTVWTMVKSLCTTTVCERTGNLHGQHNTTSNWGISMICKTIGKQPLRHAGNADDLHDLHNRDTNHLVQRQLVSFRGPLKFRDACSRCLFRAVYTGTRPGLTASIRAGKGWRGRRELAPKCSATQLVAS